MSNVAALPFVRVAAYERGTLHIIKSREGRKFLLYYWERLWLIPLERPACSALSSRNSVDWWYGPPSIQVSRYSSGVWYLISILGRIRRPVQYAKEVIRLSIQLMIRVSKRKSESSLMYGGGASMMNVTVVVVSGVRARRTLFLSSSVHRSMWREDMHQFPYLKGHNFCRRGNFQRP